MAESTKSGFTSEERAAMKERARELKVSKTREGDLAEVLKKIGEMTADERAIAERVHAIVTETAPELAPKTWYGQPAYLLNGKVICFFQSASKFKTRYCTLGFSEDAQLDDGTMWPTSFAITTLTKADEKVIAALITKAVG